MNIYLACTVRGDRGALGAARALADSLERMGHTVLTRHLLEDGVDSAESALTERAVFERDMDWLAAADLVVAEASGSSYGVGFEVGYVLGRSSVTSQRVLLVYEKARRALVSRLISGNVHPHCRVYPYEDAADLLRFINDSVAPIPAGLDGTSLCHAEPRASEANRAAAGAERERVQAARRGAGVPADPIMTAITRIHPDAQLPEYQSAEAAAFDLASTATMTIEPGRVALIPTGLVIKVPLRMFLGIFARSSTPLKKGLMVANGVGVIDPDYCGPDDEVKIAVMNFTDEAVTVMTGDRIAQGILLEAPRVEWAEAEAAPDSRGGFGSTG